MCTLTFIPGLPGGGYLLASNRDESPERAIAAPPVAQQFGKRQVLAPRDPDGGGTWIGVDDSAHCVAIMNGDKPLPPPMRPDGSVASDEPAPLSRGLLVHDLLEDPRFDSVRNELQRRERLDALHYKPFKLVVVSPGPSHGDGRAAHILRADWDGRMLRYEEERGPRCTVSSTHETEAVTNYRRGAFSRFLQERSQAIERLGMPGADATPVESLATALTAFQSSHHPDAPQGDARSVCMHRKDARTVSSTLVLVTGDQISMRYRAGWPCEGGPPEVTTLARVN